jgi:hypothetical protein
MEVMLGDDTFSKAVGCARREAIVANFAATQQCVDPHTRSTIGFTP